MKPLWKLGAPAVLVLAVAGGLWAQEGPSEKMQIHLQKEVRHELVTLPYYNVFDNLEFKVDGGTVTLLGQVTQPVIKSDAEKAVKKIEGVEQVVNRIEILPLSNMDDQIRRKIYRAIYGDPGMDRYSIQAVPSIHIIVRNGHVFLEGAVGTEMDKNLAYLRANGVSGVFSVTNNLHVDRT